MIDSVPESFPELFKMEGGPWGGLKVLRVSDQGYCGWIYEFLNFPAYTPDHSFSSPAAVLCFVFSVPIKHSIFLLSPQNLPSNASPCSLPSRTLQASAEDISPSETCHMPCCPTCPHPILPDSPLALCIAMSTVQDHAPLILALLVHHEMIQLTKGSSRSSTSSGTPPMYCDTPCPE